MELLVLVPIATIVAWSAVAWQFFGGIPRWAQVAGGVAAVILALAALVALL